MNLLDLKRRFAAGSLTGLARVALAIPLYFILTPYVLHALGTERFGLWAFGTLVISVMTLTDFGFKNALVYYVARNLEDTARINRYFNVAFLLFVAMTMLVFAIAYAAGPLIVRELLNVKIELRDEAAFVLWVTALGFGLRFVALPFQAVVEAHQRHAVSQAILLLWLVVNFVGTLIALNIRPDIYALGAISILSNLVVLAAFITYTKIQFRFLGVDPRRVSASEAKDMVIYGGGIHAATLLIASREPVLKVLIARTQDLAGVATFEIVFRLCTQLVSFVATPLLGTFSAAALLARDRTDELGHVLRPMLGFCLATFVPAILFFASFSESLVSLWLGPDFPQVSAMLPGAFTAFSVYYTTEVLYKSIEGSGWSVYSALVQSIVLSLMVGTFLAWDGPAGAAVPAALLSGFVFFSLSNVAVFRVRFPTLRLVTSAQLGWLLAPACAYLLVLRWLPPAVLPVAFFVYSILHIVCVRRANLFDVFNVARRVVKMVTVKQ